MYTTIRDHAVGYIANYTSNILVETIKNKVFDIESIIYQIKKVCDRKNYNDKINKKLQNIFQICNTVEDMEENKAKILNQY